MGLPLAMRAVAAGHDVTGYDTNTVRVKQPEAGESGNRTWTLMTTTKIVSGIDQNSLAAVEAFYRGIAIPTVAVSSPRKAELAKLIEDTFRHVNIALMNELAMFGRELGVNVWEAIDAASTKPFGYMPFYPGPGVGGHCLPIDASCLGRQEWFGSRL